MSKIAEKKVMELGHSKDPFSREEFRANDIFDCCVECYDQAMQDFLEKAEKFFNEELFTRFGGKEYRVASNKCMNLQQFIEYFKNYIENESEE